MVVVRRGLGYLNIPDEEMCECGHEDTSHCDSEVCEGRCTIVEHDGMACECEGFVSISKRVKKQAKLALKKKGLKSLA